MISSWYVFNFVTQQVEVRKVDKCAYTCHHSKAVNHVKTLELLWKAVFTIAPATACTRLSYENTSRSFRSLEPILGNSAKWLSLFYLAKKQIILFLSSDLWIIHSSRDEISLSTSTSGSDLANENACMNFLDDDWRKVALDLEVCSQSETLTAPTALNKEEL